ncbi:MAG: adenylate/guanylate cyclase domain-containing protein [Deltaproteobacteria bacterium]|nr:adenylate/guanylate cyclase domain-containing protein [Deltaproteobacteria bacterium]
MKASFKKIFSLTPFTLSVIITAIMVIIYNLAPAWMEMIELKSLDIRFRARGEIKPGPEVVIAVIDEKSVHDIGRWPWPRVKLAELIDALSNDGAKSIAFDVVFSESDKNTNLDLVDRLENEIKKAGLKNEQLSRVLTKEKNLADNDFALAQAITKSCAPVTLGYFFHMREDSGVAHISTEEAQLRKLDVSNGAYSLVKGTAQNISFREAYVPETNIYLLSHAARAAGYFNMVPDMDGTVRAVPMAIRYGNDFFMPLALQALRQYLGSKSKIEYPSKASEIEQREKVFVGNYEIPIDEKGRLVVNYRGRQKSFEHYPVVDIIKGSLPKGTFKDKIVLVGPTAIGIYDLRVTPFDSIFPGVEIHANVIDNILRQDFIQQPDWSVLLTIGLIVFFGIILGLALPKLSAVLSPILGVGLIGVWTVSDYLLFLKGYWVNLIYPLMTVILVYVSVTVFRYMTEEREKRRIKGAFTYYVNPSVVTEMLKNPEMLKLGGDKRIMTVMFSDIRGFTTISEKLDPEALVHLLNQYLTVMTDLVFKYDGLLDKYIGDAIMAFWGAPLSQPDHAKLACRTCLEMLKELETLRQRWAQENPATPFIDIGIGLNTGFMVVGNMGSETRFDYTVMGDAVNLGSRLEGTNKEYGTNIIIGEMTFEQIKEEFYCRELDMVAVKGKAQPIHIYELLGEPNMVPPAKLNVARAFARGLAAYRAQRWDEAHQIFSAIQHHYPDDKPTPIYLKRIAELKKNPPLPEWDGVFVMKTK